MEKESSSSLSSAVLIPFLVVIWYCKLGDFGLSAVCLNHVYFPKALFGNRI